MAVRLYKPDDEQALKALHLKTVEPIGSYWPYSQVVIGPLYISNFAAKVEQFPDSVILVAEEQGVIVGTVSAGLKEVQYNGVAVKTACVFDLIVFPPSKDLELKLLAELEACVLTRQVVALYSHVSDLNEEHYEMFCKLGFEVVSDRNVKVKKRRGLAVPVVKLPCAEAKKLTYENYSKRSMMPSDLESLFESPHYVGTYSIQDEEGNLAGLSLWDCSTRTRQTFLKCCIEPETLKRYWGLLLAAYGAVLLFQLWFLFFFFELVEEPILQLCVFSGGLLSIVRVLGASIDLYAYFASTLRSHKSRRARTFGLIYRGKFAYRDDLLRKVIEGTLSKALSVGFDSVAFNIDTADNDTRIYPTTKSKATVLLKALTHFRIGRWAPQSFLDPRELSL
jgi:hypothetical protein